MKRRSTIRRGEPWEIILGGLLAFILIYVSSSLSEASESHKIVEEGYYGSERFKTVQTPVRPNSTESLKKGWIGNKRVYLKVQPSGEITTIKGWEGDNYIRLEEYHATEPTTVDPYAPYEP